MTAPVMDAPVMDAPVVSLPQRRAVAVGRWFIERETCMGHGYRVECGCGWVVLASSMPEAVRAGIRHACGPYDLAA